jgi:superfamily II DNA or RNA helicase
MILRPYQQEYVDNIKLNESNLIIAPMRAGKSVIMKSIIDTYFQDKKVLIMLGIRDVVVQLSKYYKNHSFILSGKEFSDSSTGVFLATYQTFQRRDVDLNSFDAVILDEVHQRYNTAIVKEIRNLSCTRLYFTGTPLTNKNTFLGKFDNKLEFINTEQMVEQGYLTPTRFLANGNLLADEKQIGIRNGEYKEEDLELIMDKQALIDNLINDAKTYGWVTEHKTIMYTNTIAYAEKICNKFNDPNVKVLHSKLGKKEEESIMDWYDNTDAGMLINVRKLTTGFDSPSTDTVVYLFPTMVWSLYLQSIWRGSTLDPSNPNKQTTVFDYSGMLYKLSPYYSSWGRTAKPPCSEACKEFPENSVERHFCIESCKPDPEHFPVCDGKLPKSLVGNPYVSHFQVVQGKPCKEAHPVWENTYKTTTPKNTIGKLIKWCKCKCGCVTRYVVTTMTDPSQMVELYSKEASPYTNKVTVLFNNKEGKALLILDDVSLPRYRFAVVETQNELYSKCLAFFKSKKFMIVTSSPLSKLPVAQVDPKLEAFVPLVDFSRDRHNYIIKKMITVVLEDVVRHFNFKKGMTFYFKKVIVPDTEKRIVRFLSSSFSKTDFLKFKTDLEKELGLVE